MAKKVFGAIFGIAVLGGIYLFFHLLTNNKITIGYNKGYAPDQPIPYSHQLHAGQYKIDCKFCHVGAEVSRHASVPSLNICMNCHQNISTVGKPALVQLQKAYFDNKPVEWAKVHLLPDHVKFNHAAHVRKGKQCQECHGAIETMPVVSQHSSLSMGWCINCHRQPENNASVSCGTCHY